MKAFHFTLEAVGTLRRLQEQKSMEQYSRCLAAKQQAAETLEAAGRELEASWQEWRGRLAAGVTGMEAARIQSFQRLLMQRRDEGAVALEAAERRAGSALHAMLLARQQREIVDKFFDRQKARHQRDQARAEQKFLDDLGGRRGSSVLAWKPADNPL